MSGARSAIACRRAAGLRVVDLGGQVHLCVRDLAGERPGSRVWPAPRTVYGETTVAPGCWATPSASGKPGVTSAKSSSIAARPGGHRPPVGPEHDRPRLPTGAQFGEVLLQNGEAGGALGAGHLGRAAEGGADDAGADEDEDDGREPHAHRGTPVVEGPAADATEQRRRWRARRGSACVRGGAFDGRCAHAAIVHAGGAGTSGGRPSLRRSFGRAQIVLSADPWRHQRSYAHRVSMTSPRRSHDPAPAETAEGPRMRAVVQREYGGPETLHLEEIDRPSPVPGRCSSRCAPPASSAASSTS